MGDRVGMARETKVGLLAGLAFIICFAVILSNRGRTDLVSPSQSMIPQRVDLVHSPGAPGLSLPVGTNHAGNQGGSPGGQRFFSPDQAALQSMTEPAPAAALSPPRDAQRLLEERLARLEQSAGLVSIPNPTGAASHSDVVADGHRTGVSQAVELGVLSDMPVAPAYLEYTVKSGDTLWRIAQTQCGSGAKSVIDAILDLNRDKISSANNVQSGVVLRLPRVVEHKSGPSVQRTAHPTAGKGIESTTKRQGDAGPKATSPGKPQNDAIAASKSPSIVEPHAPAPGGKTKAADEKGFRWYQVKKNDRYASIARDVLGNGERWDEIHALNKDKFPDPNRIREGVRIKVPVRK